MIVAPAYPEPALELRDLVNTYLDPDKVSIILRAYEQGAEAHKDQTRISGEPYIYHPIAVARILAGMRMDQPSICAAILHDTLEDTPLTRDQIEAEFGAEIAGLVDGVTKLDKMKFRTRREASAESFRKLMLAMSRDLRVIFIKLADRMHNMRTIGAMNPDSRRRIARETLDIYAPIADRLGMNSMKLELQDLGFANLYPWRHKVISEHVEAVSGNRQEVLENITRALKRKMNDAGIPCKVNGREKSPFSIYQKMLEKDLPFSDVTDVYAFRIVTQSEPHCYQALGVVHGLYQPKPGRFKDYIALPKPNGYQSLHTVLNSPYGVPIEIQIRNEEMDIVAEKGAAAHWSYKSGPEASAQVRAREWLMQLVDTQHHTGDSLEFMEGAKSDLFPDQIFVFTPKGKIIDLRRSATALDFAYAIHTDVGNHAESVLVDKLDVPLSTILENGQTVEIKTSKDTHPKPEWLQFVATGRARASIRYYLKSLQQEDTVALGHQLLDKALVTRGSSLEKVSKRLLRKYLKKNNLADLDNLLADLALGQQLANVVAAQLVPKIKGKDDDKSTEAISIAGSEGGTVSFGNCCHPIPGDDIFGYLSAGKGIVVHRSKCHNLKEFRKHPDRCLEVNWAPIVNSTFPVTLRVVTQNNPGVLASISASIGEASSNIERVEQPESNPETATLLFTVSVTDRDHMARLMRRVKRNKDVIRVNRVST
jgi:guanosine-3',5'-bis(diphosphate) 3'-pyrophosphohydrolase